jgi:hypothetical protein
MISMDSVNASALCPRCGCKAFHSNSSECIDALRQHIAELEFKRSNPGGQARHCRERSMQDSNTDDEIPRYIVG